MREYTVRKDYLKAIFLFIIAILASLILFFVFIYISVCKNVEKTIGDNVDRQIHHFRSILNAQYQYLESTALYIGQNDELLSDDNQRLLQSLQQKSGLDRLCIVDSDGIAHYDNGAEKSVVFRRYFAEGMSGQRTLSDPLESRMDGQTKVVLGVPIFKDGQVVGVLGGSYNVSVLSHLLFEDIYEGEGSSMIVMENGTIISYDDANHRLALEGTDNFFQYIKGRLDNPKKVEVFQQAFSAGQSGFEEIRHDGLHWYVAYSPMGHNNWMMCYVVPASRATAAYTFITHYEAILFIVWTVLVLCLFLTVNRINRKKNQVLLDYANTDSLTGLENKISTESSIGKWISQHQNISGKLHVFLIMDIDYFKEINDQYGHAAGDQVLHIIGSLLKSMFRDEDIKGRIGGDEFVVFMKDLDSSETAKERAEALLSRIRKLNISELEGHRLTCSIGMACSPVQGNTYMELYKSADAALYETKRRGRNGYTLYQKEMWEHLSPDSISENTESSEPAEGGTSATYAHCAYTELNPLTGLYYNRAFLHKADELMASIENDTYMMTAIDIEHFRLFNRQFGRKEGDLLLTDIAACLKELQKEHGGIAGYFNGDNFCALMPDNDECLEMLINRIISLVKQRSSSFGFLPAFGIYRIHDTTVPASTMYDRATLALSHVYGKYDERVCFYEAEMFNDMEDELSLITAVEEGLKKGEFIPYFQPQCSIASDSSKIIGAEALVRWNRDGKPVMPPSQFIPVLEKNGLIASLDRQIWSSVAKWLENWIEHGHIPVPVSVNVSRADIFSFDVPDFFQNLILSCHLNPKLLKIEITENDYAEDNEYILKTVRQLREMGFTVMMDDFGSGYSSLNMLKNVSVDVLKMDMRFLDIKEYEEKKGIGILETVISLSHQLGLPIIVEGVETQKQVDMLSGMGCRYVQGYYFYRPMSEEDWEQLISDERNLDFNGLSSGHANDIRLRELFNQNIINDSMLNNIIGPVAFFDLYQEEVRIIRVNRQFCTMTGFSGAFGDGPEEIFRERIVREDWPEFLAIFQQACENHKNGGWGYFHYLHTDGTVLFLSLRVFFFREQEEHQIFYGALADVSGLQKG